ncbi:aldo/keto reductase [Nocardioides sp.]|jgi:aryl-alcohol dehydrogenase-like predicted oxidoreductase|uniref:aldo/keto reductase n=1 Tax=Nocardioides sp. TaxID=35761 RepID=UPI0031FF433E|nr:aldo/keto reductase [Nocardioides sp.]
MKYVRLGASGLKVSQVCLGMMSYGDPAWIDWVLPQDEAEPFVRAAADAGITFFDTADVYSTGVSEQVTGQLLRKVFSKRDDYVLATKVQGAMGSGPNEGGLSRSHIMDGVDASLRRLGMDHIDLYQIHRWDNDTPIEETMEALNDCVRSGKVRYLGASSMAAWQFAKAQRVAAENHWTPFISMHPQYNLLYREDEREMLPQCLDMGVGVIPYSPLARGRLARPRAESIDTHRGQADPIASRYDRDDVEHGILDVVGDLATRHDVSRAQVALAWLFTKPSVAAPVIGATKPHHITEAVASTSLTLTDDEVAALEGPYRPRSVEGQY